MAKYIITILLFGVLLFSCTPTDPVYKVLDGNARFNRGDYAGATISYMKAMERTNHKDWIYFNLGNAYSALGEIDPAIGELSKALNVETPELKYRVNFNLGVIYYELGDFKMAIHHFKAALEAKEKDIDAKINLELAIRRVREDSSGASNAPSRVNMDESDKTNLQKIQAEEGEVWQNLNTKKPLTAQEDW